MTRYEEYIARQVRRYGAKFSASGLDPCFVGYYNCGVRIRIRTAGGTEVTGTIGATTGWQPCFLLMRTRRSLGSCWTLGGRDTVIAVQQGRRYIPTTEA